MLWLTTTVLQEKSAPMYTASHIETTYAARAFSANQFFRRTLRASKVADFASCLKNNSVLWVFRDWYLTWRILLQHSVRIILSVNRSQRTGQWKCQRKSSPKSTCPTPGLSVWLQILASNGIYSLEEDKQHEQRIPVRIMFRTQHTRLKTWTWPIIAKQSWQSWPAISRITLHRWHQ